MLRKTMALLLCVFTPFFLGACRSTPISTPPTTDVQEVEPTKTDVPLESAKLPESGVDTALKQNKEIIPRLLPESLIGAPTKETVSRRVEYNTTINSRSSEPSRKIAWQYRMNRRGEIVGFEFSNQGGNPILAPRRDAVKNQLFTRDFQFRFDERARQDIHLIVSDWVPARDRVFRLSEIMNTLMLFFPRKFLPAIVSSSGRNIVTLPTGEEVEFDAETHEIRRGVLSETPVDLNPNRQARQFPGIDYRGSGVVVRVNSRGVDPRIGTTATVTSGAKLSSCDKGASCNQCQIPSKELWDQTGAVRFKFSTDADFERLLIARCGFSLPEIVAEIAAG